MSTVGVRKSAKKYASALFQALPHAELESYSVALWKLASVWEGSQDLRQAFTNPRVTEHEKALIAGDLAQALLPDAPRCRNFLRLLAESGAMSCIPEAALAFQGLYDALRSRLALEITSAFPTPEHERTEFEHQVRREFGELASFSWQVDPQIIGGLRVRSGDRVLDGSVQGALERLGEQLIR